MVENIGDSKLVKWHNAACQTYVHHLLQPYPLYEKKKFKGDIVNNGYIEKSNVDMWSCLVVNHPHVKMWSIHMHKMSTWLGDKYTGCM